MRYLSSIIAGASALALACAAYRTPHSNSLAFDPRVDVRFVADEADIVDAILKERLSGHSPSDSDWRALFATQGYRHLAERERGMHRPFADSAFRAFVMSDTLLQRAPELHWTLASLQQIDARGAALQALAYLPANATIRANLYLVVKPATNSFVFSGSDSLPSIFLYVRPRETQAQLKNRLTHELHHIGLNAACPDPTYAHGSPTERALLSFLGAFGEGVAMLAAAGSPDLNPHVVDDDSVQLRWDRDVSHAREDVSELSRFFADVLDQRITVVDSVIAQASTFYGVQGPWYTIGWLMASTVERNEGRAQLIRDLCNPVQLMLDYNDLARDDNSRRNSLPIWSSDILARLARLRIRAL